MSDRSIGFQCQVQPIRRIARQLESRGPRPDEHFGGVPSCSDVASRPARDCLGGWPVKYRAFTTRGLWHETTQFFGAGAALAVAGIAGAGIKLLPPRSRGNRSGKGRSARRRRVRGKGDRRLASFSSCRAGVMRRGNGVQKGKSLSRGKDMTDVHYQ